MSISDRRVGDKLAPKMDSSYRNRFKCVTLKAYTTFQGVKYWWVTATTHDGYTTLETISDLSLEWFEKEAAFFEMRHVYEFPGTTRRPKYEIMDIYSVDNPGDPSDKHAAIAKRINADRTESIVRLTLHDFSRMTVVK